MNEAALTDPQLREKWIARLSRLHSVLLDVEATTECFVELGMASRDWGLDTFERVIILTWIQRDTVVLRGICCKGPQRHVETNASLEGLLDDFSRHAAAFARVARPDQLATWIGGEPNEKAIKGRCEREKDELKAAIADVKRFGDSIAHVLLNRDQIDGKPVRLCREHTRRALDSIYALLVSEPLDHAVKRDLIDRFIADVDQLQRVPAAEAPPELS